MYKTSTRSHSASATNAAKYPTCTYSDFEYQYTALSIILVHQQKSTFLIPSYSILLHLIPLILGVRRE